mmetsp:Transcript_12435/g.16345  ORF Transcript_12435/g.16345 Transcript_12435/m.16345 type:complete len:233 (+) Transcript_12435:75-773(+)
MDHAFEPAPKKNLSGYNIYFQTQRKRILEGRGNVRVPVSPQEVRDTLMEYRARGKRVHCKTHGVIGFRQLATTVADRWKNLDRESQWVLKQQAKIEKHEYLQKAKAWKIRVKEQKKLVEDQYKPVSSIEPLQPISVPNNITGIRAEVDGRTPALESLPLEESCRKNSMHGNISSYYQFDGATTASFPSQDLLMTDPNVDLLLNAPTIYSITVEGRSEDLLEPLDPDVMDTIF